MEQRNKPTMNATLIGGVFVLCFYAGLVVGTPKEKQPEPRGGTFIGSVNDYSKKSIEDVPPWRK